MPDPSETIFLKSKAYETMMIFAKENPNNEILGIFFGKINEFGDLIIEEAYTFRVGKKNEVELEDEDYVKIVPLIKNCATRNLEWYGWFHSHPFQGDSIYMSNKDIQHQYIQQSMNRFWTALVLNPHQINDPNTTRGIRAYRLKIKSRTNKLIKKAQQMQLNIED